MFIKCDEAYSFIQKIVYGAIMVHCQVSPETIKSGEHESKAGICDVFSLNSPSERVHLRRVTGSLNPMSLITCSEKEY